VQLFLIGLGLLALITGAVGTGEYVVHRRRVERDRHLEPGGFARWVARVREEVRSVVTRLTHREARWRRVAAWFARSTGGIREALVRGKRKSLPWIAIGTLAFAGIWLLAAWTEVGIDKRSFHGIGYGGGLSTSLALLTTIVFCLLGIVFSDLVGLSHLLPGIGTFTRTTRVALIGAVVLVFALACTQLPRLAQYRSAPIAVQVQEDQDALQGLTLLPRSQRPPVLVHEAQTKLAEDQSRLRTAHYVDERLAIGAAAVEALTSWAAAWTMLLLPFLLLGLGGAAASWRADAARDAVLRENQRFVEHVARRAEQLGIEPGEVEALLVDRQPATQAAGPAQAGPSAPPPPPPAEPAGPAEETSEASPGSAEPETESVASTPNWVAF